MDGSISNRYPILVTSNDYCELTFPFTLACTINKNDMPVHDWYHTGAYGQVNGISWSCCNDPKRDSQGCRRTTNTSWHRRLLSPTHPTVQSSLDVSSSDEEYNVSVPTFTHQHPPSTTNRKHEEVHDKM